MFDPTAQQIDIRDAARTGDNLVVIAVAGSGKTSTLRLLGADRPTVPMLYVAYNKAIQLDAQGTFTKNVECRTAHSLAWGGTVGKYGDRVRKARMGALPVKDVQDFLNLYRPFGWGFDSEIPALEGKELAELVARTVSRFVTSADFEITKRNVVQIAGLPERETNRLVDEVLELTRKVWDDLSAVKGRLTFNPDIYLKLWQLSRPCLRKYKVIFLDEAQDANRAMADVFERQIHAQLIAVGDPCQEIYGWRGAANAMARWDWQRLGLTKSFRFGPAIADQANRWLDFLHAEMRVEGYDALNSRVLEPDQALNTPDAILCRTNIGIVDAALRQLAAGRKVAVVGGIGDVLRLARAAINLKAGRRANHPDLAAFRSWEDFLHFVFNDPDGEQFRVLVAMVELYGPEEILSLGNRLTAKEADADVTISTGHKCVHPDTLVETPDGLVPIRDIATTGVIATPSGARNYQEKFTKESGEILRLTTKHGYEIAVSPEHGMTVWSPGVGDHLRTQAQEIRVGDWLRLRRGATIDPVEMAALPAAVAGDVRAAEWSIPTVMSVELAELLGLLVADGSIFAEGKGMRVAKRYSSVIDRFAVLVKELFGYEITRRDIAGTLCVEVHSTQICRWLLALGGLTPHAKAVPATVLASPLSAHAAFLRGLFEDGTVNIRGEAADHIHWENRDAAVAAVVQTMLLRLDIACTRKTHHGITTLYLYSDHARRFAEMIGFIAPEKNALAGREFGRDIHSLIPLSRTELAPLERGMSTTDKQNARLRGYITITVARKVITNLGADASGVLPERMGWLYERVARVGNERGETMCVTVPEGGRFLQNGFDGENSKGREWDSVVIGADFAPRESDSEDDPTPAFSREAAMLAYVCTTRAKLVLDPGPLGDVPL